MNDSWFFTGNFCEFPDNFFDDAIKELELPVENVEHNDSVGDWEEKFQHLELPTTSVLTSIPLSLHGGNSYGTLEVNGSSLIVENKSLQPKEHSSEAKYLHISWTSSPVSVLDSSSSSSSSSSVEIPISGKRPRSKRSRSRRQMFSFINASNTYNHYQHLGPVDSEPNVEAMLLHSAVRKQTKKRNPKPLSSNQDSTEIRKCTHCEVTKTPQWREGPMGPKTLCNACGVRYRSGRLLPEYRPAASPTFIPSLHSNSHRKVLEMRKQTKGSALVGH